MFEWLADLWPCNKEQKTIYDTVYHDPGVSLYYSYFMNFTPFVKNTAIKHLVKKGLCKLHNSLIFPSNMEMVEVQPHSRTIKIGHGRWRKLLYISLPYIQFWIFKKHEIRWASSMSRESTEYPPKLHVTNSNTSIHGTCTLKRSLFDGNDTPSILGRHVCLGDFDQYGAHGYEDNNKVIDHFWQSGFHSWNIDYLRRLSHNKKYPALSNPYDDSIIDELL